jgi:outer membrane protein assembly factor BamB
MHRSLLTAALTLQLGIAVVSAQTHRELLRFIPLDGQGGDHYAASVAVHAGRVLIGSSRDVFQGTRSGSVYLFDAATGEQLAAWAPADGVFNDEFGSAVAIWDNLAAVGAHWDDDRGIDSGSVYLYDASTTHFLRKLNADDGAPGDEFGAALAARGSLVLAGAPAADDQGDAAGSAYLLDAATGAVVFKLLAPAGSPGDRFGASVALNDETAIVGAPGSHGTGAVFLFDSRTGAHTGTLMPADGSPNDLFGTSVAVAGDLVIVGSPQDDDRGLDAGAAYVFDLATQSQLAKLLSDDAGGFRKFGTSVATDGLDAIVGAPGVREGAAYAFDLNTGQQTLRFLPADAENRDAFGLAAAMDGPHAVIARQVHLSIFWLDPGGAYLFSLLPCRADLNDNGVTDTLDMLAFLNLWNAADPVADWNDDGSIDTADVQAYLNAWHAACP